MPGPLVIFGNPKKELRSESEAWQEVMLQARRGDRVALKSITDIAKQMLRQVQGGAHKNPHDLSKDTLISRHVQAIAYVHAKDGGQYVHGFGNVDPSEADLKKGWLNLNQLKMSTHVELIAHPDGTASLIGTRGQPLAALFE
jgi:hypothetical protein